MDSKENSWIIENTRNMNRNFSTDLGDSMRHNHNSEFGSKFNSSVNKSHSRDKIVKVDGKISVLFSAIRQKANGLGDLNLTNNYYMCKHTLFSSARPQLI